MKLHRLLGFTPSKESEPIPTGFKELDQRTGGLQIGEICTIGGRPGMGKTAFAVSLLRNIGVIQKVPTAYLSLELQEQQIVKRLKTSLTGCPEDPSGGQAEWIPPHDIVKEMEKIGFQIRHERKMAQEAMEMMKAAPVWIEHDVYVSMDEIISRIERLHQENQVRLIIIDGMHWIMNTSKYNEQSQEFIKLCQAAKRLKVAIVLTTMLGRAVETRGGNHRPMLSDLRDWGLLELYSSLVLLVYRPEYYRIDTFEDQTPATHLADILVEKNRFGHCGIVRMYFDNYIGFREMEYSGNTQPFENDYSVYFKNDDNEKEFPF